MARSGQVIENPRRKERVRFVRVAADTDGEVLEMWVEAEPGGGPPPLHSHPRQEERFEVVSGTLTYRIGDRDGVASPGEGAVVPAGVSHTWWNGGSAILTMRGELVPALRFETFLETIYGLQRSGRVNDGGFPSPLQAAVIFREFSGEWVPHFLPAPVRLLVMPVLAAIGHAIGLRYWYPEFSPDGPVPKRRGS